MPPTIRQKLNPRPNSGNALDNYYGWNSSMGRDVRRDPSLPHQFQYRDQGRTRVSDREPGWTDFGRNRSAPLFNQMGDSSGGFGTPNFSQPTGRPNFRAPGGFWSGIESLQEQSNLEDYEILRIRVQYGVDADEARRIYDEMIYGYDRSETDTAGLWQTWKKILEKTGNENLANQWLSGQQTAAADTGIGSTNEYQMAQLTQGQKDYMRNPYFSPGLEGAPSADELFNQVKEIEEKPGYWWNPFGSEGQEPTTREEFDEYYDELEGSFYS